MTASFLVRNPATGDIERGIFRYDGKAPKKVLDRYTGEFLKLNAAGYFWPQDPMDAYQEGIIQISTMADRIARGEVDLVKANPITYLTNVGKVSLLNFHQKRVQPTRRMYRAVEKETYGHGAVGIDSFDIDNLDIYELDPSAECRKAFASELENEFDVPEMTAQELGELLPGVPNGAIRIRLARQILETLFEYLPEETVRAFCGYLAADGNFVEAAKKSGISKTQYYRRWPRWVREAREIGEKVAVIRH